MKLNTLLLKKVILQKLISHLQSNQISQPWVIIEIKSNFIGSQISFVHDDNIRDLLGFNSSTT